MLLKIRVAIPTKVNVTRFSALNKLNYNRPIKYDANFRRIVSKICITYYTLGSYVVRN